MKKGCYWLTSVFPKKDHMMGSSAVSQNVTLSKKKVFTEVATLK